MVDFPDSPAPRRSSLTSRIAFSWSSLSFWSIFFDTFFASRSPWLHHMVRVKKVILCSLVHSICWSRTALLRKFWRKNIASLKKALSLSKNWKEGSSSLSLAECKITTGSVTLPPVRRDTNNCEFTLFARFISLCSQPSSRETRNRAT